MCVSGVFPPFGAAQRLPSMRSPVPQSIMNCVPSGAISSRHGVFPPYRHVAGSTVGVDPRTPQKLNLVMEPVISVGKYEFCEEPARPKMYRRESSLDGGSHWMERESNRGGEVSNCLI